MYLLNGCIGLRCTARSYVDFPTADASWYDAWKPIPEDELGFINVLGMRWEERSKGKQDTLRPSLVQLCQRDLGCLCLEVKSVVAFESMDGEVKLLTGFGESVFVWSAMMDC